MYHIMKANVYLTVLSVIILSCTGLADKKMSTSQENSTGYFMGGAEANFTMGDQESVKVFLDFIDKHNQKDFEGLRKLISDSISISGPRGEFIKGGDAHIAFLKDWFATGDLNWKPVWGTSVKFPGSGDANSVIGVLDLNIKTKDTLMMVNQLIVAVIKKSKVDAFWVHERQFTAIELESIMASAQLVQ
tara:strand:+ start:587 stop:1153 length:567 start_codon:yes stop_codon:yes gene_type:complete